MYKVQARELKAQEKVLEALSAKPGATQMQKDDNARDEKLFKEFVKEDLQHMRLDEKHYKNGSHKKAMSPLKQVVFAVIVICGSIAGYFYYMKLHRDEEHHEVHHEEHHEEHHHHDEHHEGGFKDDYYFMV